MSSFNHLGREVTVTAGGKEYKISRFTRRILQQFLDIVRKDLPDPVAEAKKDIAGLDIELQKLFIDDARELKKVHGTLDDPRIQQFQQSPEGLALFLYLLFRANQPDLSREQVDEICEQIIAEHGEGYLERKLAEAQGQLPQEDPERTALESTGAISPKKK